MAAHRRPSGAVQGRLANTALRALNDVRSKSLEVAHRPNPQKSGPSRAIEPISVVSLGFLIGTRLCRVIACPVGL
jgi:hypothetical protein